MSKRFTDSEKWKKAWFRKLTPAHKCLWVYICDNCSIAGIWDVDFELAQVFIGEVINTEEAKEVFKKQFCELNDGSKWFIKDFIVFQYGELKDNNNLHKAVITGLKNSGVYEGYMRGITGGKDRIGKGIGKGKVKVLVKDNIVVEEILADLNLVLSTSYKPNSDKNRELIEARLAEGFTLEDFKTVHRKMLRAWGADEKMVKYLRPLTLYGTKFESYLNQKSITTKLTPEGLKAYLVGQEWLKSKEVVDVG
jgi:uncharacterized phage protein (TIGR02220 family)